ncbi:MAG: exodeoxyribonuclease VII small subunit [Candidatus Adiutrix sp.]|jgi:exodeoxyribonuclease VII small subunit|nr:exodeoxyribonuclease VII small subunit [Candidatus Adiutrix sp.]
MKKTKEPSFEEGLARLEELVNALEDRALSLDAALTSFEEGLELSRHLRKKIEEAEGKVEMLTRDLAGRPAARPYSPSEGGENADKDGGYDADDE